jgi:hypothetical protein
MAPNRLSLVIENRRASLARLEAKHPGATFFDLTSRAPEPWVKFSPFYPHGGIPVPLSPGSVSASVEGIWQALKVFETADVDRSKLDVTSMRGLKRTVQSLGRCLGHRAGLGGAELLGYVAARRAIYLPSYAYVLRERLGEELAQLRKLAENGRLVLLDYETNCDVDDPRKPLSHAGLVRAWLLDAWPS